MDVGRTHRDWLSEIRALPKSRVFVQHNPPTPRYGRAASKLGYLLRSAVVLGVRREGAADERVEISVWAPNAEGRGTGYYGCFRLYFERDAVSLALLFCFYDGTEKSPGFRSVGAAREYSRASGFEEVT